MLRLWISWKYRLLILISIWLMFGCTGTAIVNIQPPNASVQVNNAVLSGNSFDYGCWIGNEYKITVAAPGYKTKDITEEVHLGSKAGIIAFYSVITVIGVPNLFLLPWYGQLDDEIFITLEKE